MKQFCVFLFEGKQELKLGGVDKGQISVLLNYKFWMI